MAHTLVLQPKPHHPSVDRFIHGVIRLGGVDNTIIHLVHEDESGALIYGTRTRKISSEKRRAHILDIMHFRLALRRTGKEGNCHASQV